MAPSISVTETMILEEHSELHDGVNKKESLRSTTSTSLKRTDLPSYEEIRKAIPPECFEKSLCTSLLYLVLDYIILAALYCAVPYIEYYTGWAGLMAWYWVMGIFLSSLFIIGHDCGHTTFSNYRWVNDIVGHLTHGPLMAPYWPWQKTHRQHHQYTGHLEKDKGHPWVVEEEYKNANWLQKHFSKIPISGFFSFWMVMITYLQHQDEEVKVYEEGYWSFVTGQTQTIDRYYGFGIDKAMHHITDGHVAHHFFFTKIPHYHLPKATQALREVFGKYPGIYKSRSCYHHAFEFLRLNLKLEYLVGKGTGLLMYNCAKSKQAAKNE